MLETTNKGRDIQISAFMSNGKSYYLYIKDGKPSHIECRSGKGLEKFYPNDCNYNAELEVIIKALCELENLKSLKKLYNALETGNFKKEVKRSIDKLIDRYENALTILKS